MRKGATSSESSSAVTLASRCSLVNLACVRAACTCGPAADACDRAKASAPPDGVDALIKNVYMDDLTPKGKNEPVPFIRMPDYTKSIRA